MGLDLLGRKSCPSAYSPDLEIPIWNHGFASPRPGNLGWWALVLRPWLRASFLINWARESGFGWGWIFGLIDNRIDEHTNRQDMLCTLQDIVSAAVKNIYAYKKESDNLSFAIWILFAYCSFAVSLLQFQRLLDEYWCWWLRLLEMILKEQLRLLTALCQTWNRFKLCILQMLTSILFDTGLCWEKLKIGRILQSGLTLSKIQFVPSTKEVLAFMALQPWPWDPGLEPRSCKPRPGNLGWQNLVLRP